MVTWIIECIVLVCVFLGLDFIGDKISSFPTQKDRYKAIHWLVLIAFILGSIWQVVVEHFK